MLSQLIGPEIAELIESKGFAQLREACMDLPVQDLADIIEDLHVQQAALLFRVLPRGTAADVFEYLDVDLQEALIEAFGRDQMANLLNAMAPDDRTALLEDLPPSVSQRLLTMLTPEQRDIAQALLSFPEGSVGRRMSSQLVKVRRESTVHEVFRKIRRVAPELETFDVVFVVAEDGSLQDDVTLRQLILAEPGQQIGELLDGHVQSVRADRPQREVVDLFKRYDKTILPVVDANDTLLGVITVDDVLDIAEDEETDAVHRLAGVEPLETAYLQASVWELVRSRGGWLAALLVAESLTALILAAYAVQLQAAIALAFAVPLILSAGGNIGAQASSLVARALSVGEVEPSDWRRVLLRELACVAPLGLLLSLLALGKVELFQALGLVDYGASHWVIASALAISLFVVVAVSSVTGAMLPLALRALRRDAALGSAPLIATVADVAGLGLYLIVATAMLSWANSA